MHSFFNTFDVNKAIDIQIDYRLRARQDNKEEKSIVFFVLWQLWYSTFMDFTISNTDW